MFVIFWPASSTITSPPLTPALSAGPFDRTPVSFTPDSVSAA
jgi:hypothetical protein